MSMSFKWIGPILVAFCAARWTGMAAVGAELIARWPFDHEAGTDVLDVIGNHHGQELIDGQAGDAIWVPGKFGNGLRITGPNHYVEVEQSADLELDAVTLIAWVNFEEVGGRQEVASYGDSYGIFADAGVFRALLYNGAGWDVVSGVTPIDPDTWYQTALTVDEDEINLYVNGELDGTLATPPIEYQDFPAWFGGGPADNTFWLTGVLDEIEIWNDVLSQAEILELFESPPSAAIGLQAGDADQDLDFDQLDLVQVQIAAKYLTNVAATWGEGDWDGAPGGEPGNPPTGNGVFDQLDIINALAAGTYLTGPYAAVASGGSMGDGQTSVIYNANTGELAVDAPAGVELTSINVDSAAAIFTGDAAGNLGGSFDNDADDNIFKATFGGSFGSVGFGQVAQTGLSEQFLLSDLSVVGSLAGGGDLGEVDLIYVPEPATALLLTIGIVIGLSPIAREVAARRAAS